MWASAAPWRAGQGGAGCAPPLLPSPRAGARRPGGTGHWRGHGAGVARAWRGRGAGMARAWRGHVLFPLLAAAAGPPLWSQTGPFFFQ
eukprot:gene10812-biopygen269